MNNGNRKVEHSVLIVEDEVALPEGLRIDLEECGYKVIAAENGRLALNLLAEKKDEVDLILSDEKMPVMSGFELCEVVKKDPGLQAIPFVFLTACTNDKEFLKGFQLGANDYLFKPYNYEKLTAIVNKRISDYSFLRTRQLEVVEQERLRAVEDMARGISHDMNGILNDLGFSVLVRSEVDDIRESIERGVREEQELLTKLKKIDGHCATMDQAVNLGVGLLENLQAFCQGDREEKTLHLLGNIVKIPINLFKRKFKTLGINVQCDVAEVLMECRKQDILQVALNLVRNAMQAMKESPKKELFLRLWEDNQQIYFSVADTGCGISNDSQIKIFQCGFTTKREGKGVGLASVKRIVEEYQGTISVETKVNQKTVFTIMFPGYREEP